MVVMPVQLPLERVRTGYRYSFLCLGSLFLGMCFACETFAWQTRPQALTEDITETVTQDTTGQDSTHGNDEYKTAFERNFRGDTSELFRDENGQVFLRVSLAPGFIKFSPSNCPTLQIDERIPVHHNQPGAACVISPGTVEIVLGVIINDLLVSLPLHRLMNGSQLAVRFVTSSGEYRQAAFSLSNSKQAMKSVLGANTRVEPGRNEENDTAANALPETTGNL